MSPPITSQYFFCTPTGERPYRGVDVIKAFAQEAGVSDLSVFSFTTLRKHVATFSQSLEISKFDQDQLASFLGHDYRIHRSFYRRPIDIIEKAKVAKILLAANQGVCLPWGNVGDLDEDLEEEPEDRTDEDLEEEPERRTEEEIDNSCELNFSLPDSTVTEETNRQVIAPTQNKTSEKTRGKKFIRRTWSADEIQAVKRQLNHCIMTGTVPGKMDALKAIASEPILRSRTWKNVKDYVHNLIKKNKKSCA